MTDTEKVEICCLKGESASVKKHKIISLEDVDEVTIGRSPDVTICLMSTMISRRHAVLKKRGQEWMVFDNKSINGVYVNEHQLTPLEEHQLNEGDMIRVGVPAGPNQPLVFVWSYHKQLKVAKMKRKVPEREPPGEKKVENIAKRRKPDQPNDNVPHTSPQCSPKAAEKMKKAEDAVAEKLRHQEQQLAEMQLQLQEKTAAEERLQAKLVEKEKTMQKEIEHQKEELENEKERVKSEIQEKYEIEIQQKEEELLARLAFERDELQQEKDELEHKLQEEKSAQDQGKADNQRQQDLAMKCENLSKIIEKKESEQRMLKNELQETKSESAKQKGEMLEAKEDQLRNFANLMETELQCSICNELLIQATTLNCAHSFCSLCIEEWMAVKKECPVCRAPITSHLKAIVLDSYIDRMAEHFSNDMREMRKTLVAERKVEAERKKAAQMTEPKRTRARRGGRGGRRGGRRREAAAAQREELNQRAGAQRRAREAAARQQEGPRPADVHVRRGGLVIIDMPGESQELNAGAPEVINISDAIVELPTEPIEIDSDDEHVLHDPLAELFDNSDSDTASVHVPGVPGSYYGGRGRCFRCGNRGHWAPGCPF